MSAMSSHSRIHLGSTAAAAVLLLLLQLTVTVVVALQPASPCSSTSDCDVEAGYQCVHGRCSRNKFESGCFVNKMANHSYFGRKQRVCNSDDDYQLINEGICRPPNSNTDHLELRMHSQNWESAFFEVWILQIVLSELLDVPTTIETGVADKEVNFYDPHSPFDYAKSSDYAATVKAHEVGDCRKVKNMEPYESCAYTVTEVWDAETMDILGLLEEETLERPQILGVLGEEALFVPKFTVVRDPTLLSYLGLAGEHNRRKLAEAFPRPTTWGQYCTEVSLDNCTNNDGIAAHAPPTEEDTTRMFVEGAYIGHFRNTTENDCDMWPDNCTGHVADYPCGWPSFVEQQMYHLNIALESNGPAPGSGGYTYTQLQEIWLAANATKSNVMMMYWKPELNYQTFLGTDAEFTKVVLPPRTQKCIDNRVSLEDRCSPDPAVRRGDVLGSCDKDVQQLHKLIVSNLLELVNDENIPRELWSPAYEVLSLFMLTGEHLGQMFENWKASSDPRDAVCQWVVDNMDIVEKYVPQSYPRVFHEKDDLPELIYLSIALAAFALLCVIITCVAVHHQRKRRVMRVAQIEFLWLLLAGLLCICSGALLSAIPSSDIICIFNMWFINVGYTLELVPLIIKVAAINRLMHAAKKMRRVKLNRTNLFAAVTFILIIIIVASIVWTVLDPPSKTAEYRLTEDLTDDGDTIVVKQYSCQSENMVFDYLNLGWTSLLLLVATILAFQTRNLRQDFNESQTLGIMIYSHFLFVLLRMITFFLETTNIAGPVLSRARSMIYSLDAIGTIGIYFFPKLISKDELDTGHSFSSAGVAGSSKFNQNGSKRWSGNYMGDQSFRTNGSVNSNPAHHVDVPTVRASGMSAVSALSHESHACPSGHFEGSFAEEGDNNDRDSIQKHAANLSKEFSLTDDDKSMMRKVEEAQDVTECTAQEQESNTSSGLEEDRAVPVAKASKPKRVSFSGDPVLPDLKMYDEDPDGDDVEGDRSEALSRVTELSIEDRQEP